MLTRKDLNDLGYHEDLFYTFEGRGPAKKLKSEDWANRVVYRKSDTNFSVRLREEDGLVGIVKDNVPEHRRSRHEYPLILFHGYVESKEELIKLLKQTRVDGS